MLLEIDLVFDCDWTPTLNAYLRTVDRTFTFTAVFADLGEPG